MGLKLTPVRVTTTDPDAAGQSQFFALFADLMLAQPERAVRTVSTEARLVALELPPRRAFAVDARDGLEPVALLELGAHGGDGPVEFSYAVDEGAYSPFVGSPRLALSHPLFWLPGPHTVRVRGRRVGAPATLDPEPVRIDFDIAPSDAPTAAPARAQGAGCTLGAAGGAGAPSAGACALFCAFALLLRRRRAAALAALLCGCSEGLTKGDFVSPIDEVGRYSDVALGGETLHLSAYDSTVGDLAYAEVRLSELAKPIAWQYVDGIDPGAPVDTPHGYRHGVSDPGPDVGLYTSIALTRAGEPRIAYYDASSGALKYSTGPGRFSTQVVQAGQGSLRVGLYAALDLDASDVPTIAFMATGVSDGAGGYKSELRLATAHGPRPATASDWTIATVDTTPIPCSGLCPTGTACIKDAMVGGMTNNDPAYAHCLAVNTVACASACSSSQACVNGACSAVESAVGSDLPEGTGLFVSVHRAGGRLLLVYHDHEQGDLKLASGAPGGSFQVALIDGGTASDLGSFASAQAATDGTLHVVYRDVSAGRLLYKMVSPTGAVSPTAEVVDDGVRDDGVHPVGAGADLVLDGATPRVVYQDQTLATLEEARRAGPGWTHASVRPGPAGHGFWPHLVRGGGGFYLTEFTYDRARSGQIGALVITPMP
jgi:hypothetical protein